VQVRKKISLSTVLSISCEIGVKCVDWLGLLIVQITILRLSTALIEWGGCRLYCVLHKESMDSMVI
jgi:hypothetical protein